VCFVYAATILFRIVGEGTFAGCLHFAFKLLLLVYGIWYMV
jgi:hypothetical protein